MDNRIPNFQCLLVLCFIISFQCQTIVEGAEYNQTWEEAFEVLGISWNPDGTLTREIRIPMVPPTPTAENVDPTPVALSTDILLEHTNKTYLRLFIPVDTPKDKKLPIIIYLHGSNFVLYSATTAIFHNFANDVASQVPAVVISVEYRLAPEHRLPAAYDDALSAIFWARRQAALGDAGRQPWMEYADFSRVYLLGSSAGANIAFHAALRSTDFDIRPLQIRGLLMNQGLFGGVQRTPSEIRLIDDPYAPLYLTDVLWVLALPKGLNREHPFCNPISGGAYGGQIFRLPKVYIKSDFGHPLVDRSVQLVQFLHSFGVPIVYRFNQGGFDGIEFQNRTAAQELYDDFKFFINDLEADAKKDSIEPLYVDMNNGHRQII